MPPKGSPHLASAPRTTGVDALKPAARDAAEATPSIENTRPRAAETTTLDDGFDVLHLANGGRAEITAAFNALDDGLDPHRPHTAGVALDGPGASPEAPSPGGVEGSESSAQIAAIADSRSDSLDAGERRLRSWRRLGLALEGIALHLVNRAPRDRQPNEIDNARLIELGISKNQATRARALAGISDGDFEAYLAAARVDGANVTVGGALRRAAVASGVQNPTNPVDPGTRGLREFRRNLNAARRAAGELELGEQVTALQHADSFRHAVERTFEPDVAAARAAPTGEGTAQ